MARDEFWDGLKEDAKRNHDIRVAKTPERIDYAIQQLEKSNIEYQIKNPDIGHLHAWDSEGKLQQFWVGTGKILGTEKRGIQNFIKIIGGKK